MEAERVTSEGRTLGHDLNFPEPLFLHTLAPCWHVWLRKWNTRHLINSRCSLCLIGFCFSLSDSSHWTLLIQKTLCRDSPNLSFRFICVKLALTGPHVLSGVSGSAGLQTSWGQCLTTKEGRTQGGSGQSMHACANQGADTAGFMLSGCSQDKILNLGVQVDVAKDDSSFAFFLSRF